MSKIIPRNFFAEIPDSLPEELIQELENSSGIRLERIVSQGHSSPENFWYNQDENEWIIVLAGASILEFEKREVKLCQGDYLLIPAHQKHRVKWTDPDQKTVWLAVFYK